MRHIYGAVYKDYLRIQRLFKECTVKIRIKSGQNKIYLQKKKKKKINKQRKMEQRSSKSFLCVYLSLQQKINTLTSKVKPATSEVKIKLY